MAKSGARSSPSPVWGGSVVIGVLGWTEKMTDLVEALIDIGGTNYAAGLQMV